MNQRKRILIVEDQSDLRRLLRMTLEMVECEVHEADNGPQGLSMAMAVKPDIVILDVMLPGGIDGCQICRMIKKDPATRNTYVILLSARNQKTDIEAGLAAGADRYMSKPFSPLELVEAINKTIN